MAFDKSMDKELFSESVDVDYGRLTVSVFSYNNGTPKLQLTREAEDKQKNGELTFAKLGRMTKKEVESILPLVEKAMEFM